MIEEISKILGFHDLHFDGTKLIFFGNFSLYFICGGPTPSKKNLKFRVCKMTPKETK